MPRKPASHPFDALIQHAANLLSERLAPLLGGGGMSPKNGRRRRRISALRGKKLDMSCRVAGCKNRSGGPRHGFMCPEHEKKLSKREQAAAREAWNAKAK